MKKYLIITMLLFVSVCVSGCSEFMAGVGFGASIIKELEIKAAQEKAEAEAALAKLRAEKESIEALVAQIKDSDIKEVLTELLDPNVPVVLDKVKDSVNEPEDYISYGIALIGIITAYYQRRKRMRGL